MKKIALLGGGQLGRMFIENALRYDVEIAVMDPDPSAPCAGLTQSFTTGDLMHKDGVIAHAREADVVGIEIEHVSVEALEELKRLGKTVIPDPAVLRVIQDKGLQKEFYREHGIPTSPFRSNRNRDEARNSMDLFPAFLKTRTGGYDGRGVVHVATPDDIPEDWSWPSVLERQVDVAKELAVIVVRSATDQRVYDPVEMVFDPRYNLVDHLRAPARINDPVARRARDLGRQVAEAFGEPGIYAVEMFLDRNGELLVNETAPRAHNSGHHTIEACASSQFDQLLRIYMGWPLGDTRTNTPAAMINLVGEQGEGAPHMQGLDDILHLPGTFVHLYGKKKTRTGRKMGHITVTAHDHNGLDQAIAVTKIHCRVVPVKEEAEKAARP